MNVPDGIEPMIGYRAFVVSPDDTKLKSTAGYGDGWDPGPNQAFCYSDSVEPVVAYRNGPDGLERVEVDRHGVIPAEKCSCGFWTLNTPGAVAAKFLGRDAYLSTFAVLFGQGTTRYVVARVKTWGRVVVGARGTRSEYAEIAALLSGNAARLADSEHLAKIAAEYGVPVEACPVLDMPEDMEKEERVYRPIPYTHPGYSTITADKMIGPAWYARDARPRTAPASPIPAPSLARRLLLPWKRSA